MKDEVSEHDLTTKRDAKKRKKEKKKDKKKKHRSKRHKGSDATTTASVEEEDGGNGTSSTSPRLLATPAMDPPQQSSGSSVNDTLDPSKARPVVESSALDFVVPEPVMAKKKKQESSVADDCTTTLLLFYQYVEPVWGISRYERAKKELGDIARTAGLTGRMRVAREGLNCTLTGPAPSIAQFCHGLREWDPVFRQTEFKLTHDLPNKQRFPQLKVIPVLELVHYGLEGDKAPPIHRYHGTHLEPADYHRKLAEQETVVIDVRNHYEAVIGRFDPPNSKWLDPKMRKSTSFPVWLDDPNTKKELANKQVLMYCTGGIRCERASALLKYKMETDPEMSQLNIKGVYQLQGGIDKYFKEFPDGGYWKGKNYVFDKRFAHAPPAVAAAAAAAAAATAAASTSSSAALAGPETPESSLDAAPAVPADAAMVPATAAVAAAVAAQEVLGKCESCGKPWDMFRGKRRCPTCGVPSLICKDCWQQEAAASTSKSSHSSHSIRDVRCDLCVEQNIRSKRELRAREQREVDQYEARLKERGLLRPTQKVAAPDANGTAVTAAMSNPDRVTRLLLKNMCRRSMTEEVLLEHLSGITHIVWKMDHRTQTFLGMGWVEMDSPESAARAVAQSGQVVLERPLYVEYQPPNGKDVWPPPSSAVMKRR